MGRNKKSRDEAAPEFTSGNWTEDDSRELQLMLMADELATIAYRTVDWRDVAVLGRAIVALAEKAAPQSMK